MSVTDDSANFNGDDVVPSPCVQICHLDLATDLCMGCFRSRAELASWPKLTAGQRRAVLELVAMRRQQVSPSD
jgi:predicted Fe-S protein YdhL (DUF1289 family)